MAPKKTRGKETSQRCWAMERVAKSSQGVGARGGPLVTVFVRAPNAPLISHSRRGGSHLDPGRILSDFASYQSANSMADKDASLPEQSLKVANEEWVFQLQVPPHVDQPENYVELRHQQPQISHYAQQQPEDSIATAAVAEEDTTEREALLAAAVAANEAKSSSWTFQSPYWSISSTQLLSITYSAAWKNLPEYTNNLAKASSLSCCSCVYTNDKENDEDPLYTTDVFTVDDIVQVDTMTPMVAIANDDDTVVPPQTGLRVTLRPLDYRAVDSQVPPYLRSAWNQRRERLGTTTSPSPQDTATGPVLEFCLARHLKDAPLLSRVTLPVNPECPIAVRSITMLDGSLSTTTVAAAAAASDPVLTTESEEDTGPRPTHIYINGYQSWSFAGSVPRGSPQPKSALPDVFSRAFNLGGTLPPGQKKKPFYQSDFFACITSDGRDADKRSLRSTSNKFPFQELDETGGPALLLGWLSQREQFGIITSNRDLETFQMHCSLDGQWLVGSGSSIQTDWSYIQLIHPHSYDQEPMADYLRTVADLHQARPLRNGPLLTGWCSWYVFYEKINAGLLRENCARLASVRSVLPTNVVVVDDGYMTAWGDWDSLQPQRFTTMQAVARDIRAHANMRPGVWLAPFAADKKSRLALHHPDWIIRNDAGQPANSSHCGKFFYGLDATNPDVLEHVRATIRRATVEWGFNVLKIDFLYAACLEGNGKYDPTMSRAQTMRVALQTIREAAGPDVFLIGCGCPIATGIGYMDAMRISADTGPTWYPSFPLPKYDNGTLPALRAMLRNSMSRAPLGHRWWHNDPDCIMLGKHTRLKDEEVTSAATIVAMTCGMLLLSDDLPKVSAKRLNIVSKIYPLTGITATVLDLHSTNDGLPSLLRLWCTDKYGSLESFHEGSPDAANDDAHNAEATHFGRESSKEDKACSTRKRNCIHVTKGLGTWTVVSVSNWADRAAVLRIPPPALLPPPHEGWGVDTEDPLDADYGYHVFGFWSSQYKWQSKVCHDDDPNPETITRKFRAHESEIYHIKRVTGNSPQYIGSDLHFTCGYEVRSFRSASNHGNTRLSIVLRSNCERKGSIFVYIPRVNVSEVVKVANGFSVTGTVPRNGTAIGRILRIPVEISKGGTGNTVIIDY